MFKIVVITTPQYINEESKICNELFANGLEILHIRKPDSTQEDLINFILQIEPSFRNRIVLHNNYELINEYGLKGIHLTYRTKDTYINKANDNYDHVSISFHSKNEITKNVIHLEYGFLSPIFDSISKKGYESPFHLSDLKDFLSHVHIPIFALGGIKLDNVKQTYNLGFQGAALLGYIWEFPEFAVSRYNKIRNRIFVN